MKFQVLIVSIMLSVCNQIQAVGLRAPTSQVAHSTSADGLYSHNAIGSSSVVPSATHQKYLDNLKDSDLIRQKAEKDIENGSPNRYMATDSHFFNQDLAEDNKATRAVESSQIPQDNQPQAIRWTDTAASKIITLGCWAMNIVLGIYFGKFCRLLP